jgi:hypothetical protein
MILSLVTLNLIEIDHVGTAASFLVFTRSPTPSLHPRNLPASPLNLSARQLQTSNLSL